MQFLFFTSLIGEPQKKKLAKFYSDVLRPRAQLLPHMHRNSSYHGLTVESPAAERKSAAGLLTPRNSSLMRNSSTTSRNTGSTAPRPQLKKKDRLERALAFNLGKLSTANEVLSVNEKQGREWTSCFGC